MLNDTMENEKYLLKVCNLTKWFLAHNSFFSRTQNYVKAVNGVSFSVKYGETLGVVGESGCGKSTMGRTILRLLEATSGEVYFEGEDILRLSQKKMKEKRKEMQIIFQDPYASLDPRMTVGDIISEPLYIQTSLCGKKRTEKVLEAMEMSGLNPKFMNRYSHEFSGGQRQRVGIARAIISRPKLIVCDEPVSALDVSIQAQGINLLKDLQQSLNMTYIFISHDLSVIKHISDRVLVMYLGNLVELSPKQDLFTNPAHPYTRALLSAIPSIEHRGRGKENKIVLQGDLPSPLNLPSGCCFHTRCFMAKEICSEKKPKLKLVGHEHLCACHFC
jgi:oligopeptide transport system ATP-binding protein